MKQMLAFAVLGALSVAAVPAVQAASVSFNITEGLDTSGNEACVASWSSDPGATITVTRVAGVAGEVWSIDLSASGHQVPGAAWPNGFMIATWEEPEHPGLWNNLYIVDSQHLRLESEWDVATGDNMGAYPGGFGNGVSYYGGTDFNGDKIYVRVSETEAVPTEATTWGQIKGLYR